MSKIGKQPIQIPSGVEVKIADRELEVKGKLGAIKLPVLDFVNAEIKDNVLQFKNIGNHKQARSNWGTMRALAQNAVKGVAEGYMKMLEIEGIGFRATMEGKNLILNVGFTHPVKIVPPEGITITVDKTGIKISGYDRAVVGEIAAQIRAIKKPEPYLGKGIHYKGEVIRRKSGKKVGGTGTAAAA